MILFISLFCISSLFAQQTATLSVTITPGSRWNKKHGPQHAVWIEKEDGTFVTTLFVTQRAAKRNWLFAPKNGRPESLPVWYRASQNSEAKKIGTSQTDAISAATPSQKKTYSKTFQLEAATAYVVKVEVNSSFDYNEYWPKHAKKNDQNYSGVNGQPSVVYSGVITTQLKSNSPAVIELQPAGTGSPDGSDGIIHDNLNSLTTALSIIGKIQAEIE